MAFDLEDAREDVVRMLGGEVDAETWSTPLLDEALRQALRAYSLHGPAYEVDLTVDVSGHEQDLSAIADLLAIECVAYPWHDGLLIEDQAVRWRRVGAFSVRLDGVRPMAGETLRVRYRRAHTVDGLDGASTTTLVDAHRSTLAAGVAGYAIALRLRQISENPALPLAAARDLEGLRLRFDAIFVEELDLLTGVTAGPVWARVGL